MMKKIGSMASRWLERNLTNIVEVTSILAVSAFCAYVIITVTEECSLAGKIIATIVLGILGIVSCVCLHMSFHNSNK